MKRLSRSFFERPPQVVAEKLIGSILIHKTDRGLIAGKIVETEAYGDMNDLASHARFGKTARTKIMYGHPGILYIYKIYGIFSMANIICEARGKAGAVLLRSIEVTEGKDIAIKNLKKSRFAKANQFIATGPGKLALAFTINSNFNSLDLITSDTIYLVWGEKPSDIIRTNRIGVDYAKYCKDFPWRFYAKNNQFVSKK